jgi:ATP phosphoribosyltransferase
MLKIALTKGRLENSTVDLFEKMGLDVSAVRDKGRKLILPVGQEIVVVLAKAPDVITYVEHGAVDLGVVGKDTIAERGGSFYEVLDLGFGKCKFALATRRGKNFYEGYEVKRLASKYPNVTREFFAEKGMDVDIIKIEGSVELAPLLNVADGIVDIVETGTTLRENGLVEVEDVMPISARLIVNTASMKLKKNEINDFIDQVERLTGREEA